MATPIQNRSARTIPQSTGIFKRISNTLGQLLGLNPTSQARKSSATSAHNDQFVGKTPYAVAAPRGLEAVSRGHVQKSKPSDAQMVAFLDEVRKPSIRVS